MHSKYICAPKPQCAVTEVEQEEFNKYKVHLRFYFKLYYSIILPDFFLEMKRSRKRGDLHSLSPKEHVGCYVDGSIAV